MDVYDEEILNVFRLFNKHEVAHILVGGFAVNFHGHSRYTADLDIWIDDTANNRKRLSNALTELYGYEIPGVETMQFIPGWSSISLPSGFPLDILADMKGLEEFSFEECLKLAVKVEIEGAVIGFLSLKHLLSNKGSVGRPKDLLDIEELKRLNGDNAIH